MEYGGTQPPFDNTEWRTAILDNEQYFIDLESYNTDSGCQDSLDNADADSIESLQFGDTETEDSEFDEDDRRVLSPKRTPRSMVNIEEIFLKNELNGFGTMGGDDGIELLADGDRPEKEVEDVK